MSEIAWFLSLLYFVDKVFINIFNKKYLKLQSTIVDQGQVISKLRKNKIIRNCFLLKVKNEIIAPARIRTL